MHVQNIFKHNLEHIVSSKIYTRSYLNIDLPGFNEDISALCSILSNQVNLQTLKIHFNHAVISTNGAQSLCSALSSLINLTNLSLNLFHVWLGENEAQALGSALLKLTNLQNLTLFLGECQISHKGASYISSRLANCSNLTNLILGLSTNNIKDKGASSLGSALANCINLKKLTLNVHNNDIGEHGIIALSSALVNCPKLQNLSLKFNCIDLVGSAQENCINLTNLALIHNTRRNEDNVISKLISKLLNLANLSHLELQLKDFGQKLALSLHNALQFCTNLTSLRLYICRFHQISRETASDLGKALSNCTQLQTLKLELNCHDIGYTGQSAIATGIAKLTNLKNLYLSFHSAIKYNKMLKSLQTLTNLTNLSIKLQCVNAQIKAKGIKGLCQTLAICANLRNFTFGFKCHQMDLEGALALGLALNNCTNLVTVIMIIDIGWYNSFYDTPAGNIQSLCMKSKRLVQFKFWLG